MKKLLAIIALLAIVISLTACDIPDEISIVVDDEKIASVEVSPEFIDKITENKDTEKEESKTEDTTDTTEKEESKTEDTTETPDKDDAVTHTHSYTESVQKNPTCTQTGTKLFACSCGDSYTQSIPATGHKFGSWYVSKEATTQSEGVERRDCNSCTKYETRAIAKLPHTHSYTESVQKNPTCTQTGTKLFACSCGDSYTQSIPATGHKFGSWYVSKEATTQSEGVERRDCTNCTKYETRAIAQLENVFFNASNNTYDLNTISIKPRYVYWKDGRLYAECFVINGYNHNVYNINVKSFTIGNPQVQIASASFGTLENVVLSPYTYVIWTFVFDVDCVDAANADLSTLLCSAGVSNNY